MLATFLICVGNADCAIGRSRSAIHHVLILALPLVVATGPFRGLTGMGSLVRDAAFRCSLRSTRFWQSPPNRAFPRVLDCPFVGRSPKALYGYLCPYGSQPDHLCRRGSMFGIFQVRLRCCK